MNTLISDLCTCASFFSSSFSFSSSHQLSCFRDEILFFLYLYQRRCDNDNALQFKHKQQALGLLKSQQIIEENQTLHNTHTCISFRLSPLHHVEFMLLYFSLQYCYIPHEMTQNVSSFPFGLFKICLDSFVIKAAEIKPTAICCYLLSSPDVTFLNQEDGSLLPRN